MLARVTSRELAELKAYELFNGPIGKDEYTHDVLAAIHEQLQQIGRLLIAQNASDEDEIPDIAHYPRSREVRDYLDYEPEEDVEARKQEIASFGEAYWEDDDG